MGIHRFEELNSWMAARELTGLVYRNFSSKKDYGFWSQITRASISVMNNVSEGFESESDNDFIRFLGYARASCGEVRSMVYIALDIGYIGVETQLKLLDKCKVTSGAIYGMIKYLKNKKTKYGKRKKD